MAATGSQPFYRFKEIQTVPTAKNLIDIVLSRTQRKTPTEVHRHFKISRIRSFYMRKVRFCQQCIHEKLDPILSTFPKLEEIHPFYADLCNVLYDRDHYKLALGQVNTVRWVVDRVGKDYVRLLKYADSLYKCKMLKRAALGRMCTALRKLQASMQYLEEVRQHMSRLPCIHPHTRSLILAGYPNVGKSSFMNQVTRANVEVQPYPFTTKSLYVGHFDYQYARWQVIDTPGVLDRPLEDRNSIEMVAITALAHIQSTVLYFFDLSEECGYTLENQLQLFHSIKSLFKNKPIVILLNKMDKMRLGDLSSELQEQIVNLSQERPDMLVTSTSSLTGDGIDDAKNKACDLLLDKRLEVKVKASRVDTVLNRLTITSVATSAERPPCIPSSVLKERSISQEELLAEQEHKKTQKDMENDFGGPGVYSVDIRENFVLEDESWKYDMVPELFDGKNISDFVDPDIEERIRELEEEEFTNVDLDEQLDDSLIDWTASQSILKAVHEKVEQKKLENRLKQPGKGPTVYRKRFRMSELKGHMDELGMTTPLSIKPKPRRQLSALGSDTLTDYVPMKIDDVESSKVAPSAEEKAILKSRVHQISRLYQTKPKDRSRVPGVLSRIEKGVPSTVARKQIMKVQRLKQRKRNSLGKKGDADRFVPSTKPKHLFSGKRKLGKTSSR